MNDYSEYLKQPGMLAWIEQEWKEKPQMHDWHASVVNGFIQKYRINDVVEVGCGTGELATRVTSSCYSGYDANCDCLTIAAAKNPDKSFACADVRSITADASLVISFGFLKHFGLHEWADIFNRVASFGEYFIFDMPIAEQTKDDGEEYHHVWMSIEDIHKHIKEAGLSIEAVHGPGTIEPIYICKRNG